MNRNDASGIKNLDLLIMCGNRLRHKYFAIKLMKKFPQSAVLIEKHFDDETKTYKTKDTATMRQHFKEFQETEKEYFQEFVHKNQDLFNSRMILEIPPKTLNDKKNVEFIKKLNPKIIAIHSTSLIRDELISTLPRRLINLHAGLSPYYRGSGTNIWPFYNKELEYVGMTAHYIDIGIDSGDIILQGRPKFDANDNTHTIGCKSTILGAELMGRVIDRYLKTGPVPAVKQGKIKGKLYLKKHFTDDTILQIKKHLKQDLVKDYIENPKEVDIVEW